jgi:hypothetical protein
MTALRRVAFLLACTSTTLIATGCTSKTALLVCTGTVQQVGKPETAKPSPLAAVRVTKWPGYTKLWNKSYGDVRISEPFLENFTNLEVVGDHLVLRKSGETKVSGALNRISGHLQVHDQDDLYDLNCKQVTPLTPE